MFEIFFPSDKTYSFRLFDFFKILKIRMSCFFNLRKGFEIMSEYFEHTESIFEFCQNVLQNPLTDTGENVQKWMRVFFFFFFDASERRV